MPLSTDTGADERHGDPQNLIPKDTETMTEKNQYTRFAGVDWGSESHQVCILDREGQVLGEKAFSHSGEGFHQMLDWMRDTAGCDLTEMATSIEVPHGPVVESLMERGIPVFSIHPKQLDRFRDRFSPAGAKDDRRDARVLADALRTDPDCLRALDPEHSDLIQLREWSRMEAEFPAQRTRLMHQLRAGATSHNCFASNSVSILPY